MLKKINFLRLLIPLFLVVSVLAIYGSYYFEKTLLFADADGTPPIINNIMSTTSTGMYDIGDTIPITLNFSEPVRSTGNVMVNLNSGGSCSFNVNGNNYALCNYTVAEGENTPDLDVISIVGIIKDMSNNSMTDFNPLSTLSQGGNLEINTSIPIISSISSYTWDGAYKLGQTIYLKVEFSKAVTSTGVVLVQLNSGGDCSFTITNSTQADCNYVIAGGHVSDRLDVTSISGIIHDRADRLLTDLTPQNNISANKTIVIDAVLPQISSVTTITDKNYLKVDDSISLQVNFTEEVTGHATVNLSNGGSCYFYFQSKSHTASCTYKVSKQDQSAAVLNVSSLSGTIYDRASNILVDFTPQTNLEQSKVIGVDVVYPTVQISGPAGVYGYSYDEYGYYDYLTYDNSVVFTGSISDAGSGLDSVSIDGVNYGIISVFAIEKNTSKQGSYTSVITLTDKAGNTSRITIYAYRGFGDAVCNYSTTMFKPLSLTRISVPIWKYLGKKKWVKTTQYVKATKKVRTWKYDKVKHRVIRGWKTVSYKKKITKWQLQYVGKDAKKVVSSSMTLTVNSKCSEQMKRIFSRIYTSADRPIINPAETACYRKNNPCRACRHDYGVACDINVSQNAAFKYVNGIYKPYAGSYWKPGAAYSSYPGWSKGSDPLSIPPDGSIAKAYESENWGGQLTGDYMHFSLDGS